MSATVANALKKLARHLQLPEDMPAEQIVHAAARRRFLRFSTLAAATAGGAALFSNQLTELSQAASTSSGTVIRYTNDRLRFHYRSFYDHEIDHVKFLQNALGSNAQPLPNFRNLVQPDLESFIATSQMLENNDTAAYRSSAPYIYSPTVLQNAASIGLVEARHAGFINNLVNDPVTGYVEDLGEDQDFEPALTIDQIVKNASPFIANLNGGTPLTFSTTPSTRNDIAIQNFALRLEALGMNYYMTNVPRFFPKTSS